MLKHQINGPHGEEIWLLVCLTSGELVDKLVKVVWLLVRGFYLVVFVLSLLLESMIILDFYASIT